MYNINIIIIIITFHDPQYKYIICMYTSEKHKQKIPNGKSY